MHINKQPISNSLLSIEKQTKEGRREKGRKGERKGRKKKGNKEWTC